MQNLFNGQIDIVEFKKCITCPVAYGRIDISQLTSCRNAWNLQIVAQCNVMFPVNFSLNVQKGKLVLNVAIINSATFLFSYSFKLFSHKKTKASKYTSFIFLIMDTKRERITISLTFIRHGQSEANKSGLIQV